MWVYNLDNLGFIIHETQEEQQLLVSFFLQSVYTEIHCAHVY